MQHIEENFTIYGAQYNTTPKDTLSLNANVTINNLNSSSDGTLTVTYVSTYLDDTLYIKDIHINTKTFNPPKWKCTFAGERLCKFKHKFNQA